MVFTQRMVSKLGINEDLSGACDQLTKTSCISIASMPAALSRVGASVLGAVSILKRTRACELEENTFL